MDAVYDIRYQQDACKIVCLVVRIALPHDRNNVAWNNCDFGGAYRAVFRVSDRTCLSAKSGPAKRNQDGEDLTVKAVKFRSCTAAVDFYDYNLMHSERHS